MPTLQRGTGLQLFNLVNMLILAFATTAFARQQPAPPVSQPAGPAREQTAADPPVAGTKATLYVYRLREARGMSNKPSVYVDEREVAWIESGRFFVVNIDPGQHVVRSIDKASAVILEMKPGQAYYVRVAQGAVLAGTTLVPPEQGSSEIEQTEPSNPSDIRDSELVVAGATPPKPAPVPAPVKAQNVPDEGAPAPCRSVAIKSSFCWTCLSHRQYEVLDVVNYPNARIGQKGDVADLVGWQNRDGVKILLLTKGYTPQDLAMAHNFCQSMAAPKGEVDVQVGKSAVEQDQKKDAAAQPPAGALATTADAEGFVLYEGQKSQFTIALPRGWIAYDQSQMLPARGNSQFNLILFYLPPDPVSQDPMSVELLAKIATGEIPAFFVQKFPAKNGMSCAGFSEKAGRDVLKLVTDDPMFSKGATILEAPHSEPVPVAGCKGIRTRGTGKPARESTPQTSDVYAVSDGKTLYLFALRGVADNYKKNAEVFQKSVATARLTAAR